MEMWKLWRPAEENARKVLFFAQSKSGLTLTINAPEEDIEMYFDGQDDVMYVYAEIKGINLSIVGRALEADW